MFTNEHIVILQTFMIKYPKSVFQPASQSKFKYDRHAAHTYIKLPLCNINHVKVMYTATTPPLS